MSGASKRIRPEVAATSHVLIEADEHMMVASKGCSDRGWRRDAAASSWSMSRRSKPGNSAGLRPERTWCI